MDNQARSSARARIQALLDESSFVEIGALVQARATDFNMAEKKAPSDGVVTAYGTIDGRLVYVYAQDASVLGGSMGEMHARKIANLYDMAMKMGAPVIALTDCSGLRLEEANDALFGMGRIYHKQTLASGVIPQLAAVFGTSGGGMSVLTALSDFVFLEKEHSRLFLNAPDAVFGNKDDAIAKAESQMENGAADFAGTEEEILAEIRRLIAILPSNNEDFGAVEECTDDLNRSVAGIEKLGGAEAVKLLADNGIFIQTRRDFAPDLVTGFIQLNGQTTGVVATTEEALRWKGVEQAAALVNFCDAFELPVLTLTNVRSYYNNECNERKMPRAAAKLAAAYSNASVPMVTVVKNAIGTAGLTLGSKALGIDYVYAYPDSKLGVMDAKKAAEILAAEQDEAGKAAIAKEFDEKKNSALSAAQRGYVDDLIQPEETRQRIIAAFEMLYTKSVYRPDKKHGTV
ncbi:MAG: carboxyl transferase domain-containing protein [Oribacterium sp.]